LRLSGNFPPQGAPSGQHEKQSPAIRTDDHIQAASPRNAESASGSLAGRFFQPMLQIWHEDRPPLYPWVRNQGPSLRFERRDFPRIVNPLSNTDSFRRGLATVADSQQIGETALPATRVERLF
jgi:hypothetical protein